jgi:hypothetical protein
MDGNFDSLREKKMEKIQEVTTKLHEMSGERSTVATMTFTPDEEGSGFQFDYRGDPFTLISLLAIAKAQMVDLVINGPKKRILRGDE